jgi:fructose-1-phosphate kinase PfkB-like protein
MNICTLTGNLLAEWTFFMPEWRSGTTQRAREMSFQLGGKGINVSRVLAHLGEETHAVGFASGPLADLAADWLRERGIEHRFFALAGGLRPGVVVRETGTDAPETTFLGQDLPVAMDDWAEACAHIATMQPAWLAICGSLPGWQPDWLEPLRALLNESPRTRLALDTYGPPLDDLARLPAEVVKINAEEGRRLLPDSPARSDIRGHLPSLLRKYPVRNWILTDGPGPIHIAAKDQAPFTIRPASIKEVSPTGSGDTFLAALLARWSGESAPPPRGALAYASACASANAARPGIADFPLPVAESHYPVQA